ncbi:hypothetical protein KA082_00580 [Candidatus Woesebacteria bacterium]|nr:hypothetical protein [Candidatus Woesebacteria bacterium]
MTRAPESASRRSPSPEDSLSRPQLRPLPQILQEIATHPDKSPNGFQNPFYDQAKKSPFTKEFVLEQVAHTRNGQQSPEKTAAHAQYEADAVWLVERVQAFEEALSTEFAGTALFDETQPFTEELVFKLYDFLVRFKPEKFPVWDCNPITRYSHEMQVMNFAQRTLYHIGADMVYIHELCQMWNTIVDGKISTTLDLDSNALKLDPYYMMCRALLHDLGRFFTQDSRAHEEIPAAIAVRTGLRRDLLTLDDGNQSTHPRWYLLINLISKKTLIRIFEFWADFNSKPDNDSVPEGTIVYMNILKQLEKELAKVERYAYILKLIQQLEQLRQGDLRRVDRLFVYFLYSGRGYEPTTRQDAVDWRKILTDKYAEANPDKLKYLLTEAQMLVDGVAFLKHIGIDPVELRKRVVERWQKLGPDVKNIRNCFPELEEAA